MAIARKDKMVAGYNGNLESVKIYDNVGTSKVQTTNGVFVVVEGLDDSTEREVKKARLADKDDVALDVLFVHNSEVMYDERKYRLEDFVIEADKVARAYRLHDGDVMTLTTDLFVGTPVVGDQLVVHTDGKLGVDAVALPNAKFAFEVIEDAGNELHTTMTALAVQVIRN